MRTQDTVKGNLKEIFTFISAINTYAYNDIYLLSNQVLCKHPFNNTFLENYLKHKSIKPVSYPMLSALLFIYYVRSIIKFGKYVLCKISYHLSRQEFDLSSVEREIVLIDVFFPINRIEKEKAFNDLYFIGLDKVLRKMGKKFAYVPFFYPQVTPFRLYRNLRLLKRKNTPVLTEFQLLSWSDLLSLCVFLITYPFHVMKLAYSLRDDSYKNILMKYELLATIKQVTIFGYVRYLQGKRISSISNLDIKFISWYENQVQHKNMYKGLRSGKKSVLIYGCQLFLYPTSMLSVLVDETESFFDVLPDKILVNGSYYLPDNKRINCVIGPSLRYKRLFNTPIDFKTRKNILVLLPYIDYEIENILRMLNYLNYRKEKIVIKN